MAGYQTTPLSVDTYSRTMVNLFDEKDYVGCSTMFQSFFGRPETGAVTQFSPDKNLVDIDIIRANERITALVPRGTVSKPLGGTQKNTRVTQWTNFNRTFPLAEDECTIDAVQVTNRQAGNEANADQTRFDNMRMLAARGNKEMVRKTVRTFEYLASQSILEGKMPAIIGTTDTDLLYDFRRNTNLAFNATTVWSNAAADALADIDKGWSRIRQYGKVSADAMVLGNTSMSEFLQLTDVIAKADNRRFELIEVNQNMPVPSRYDFLIKGGATARGRLLTPEGHEIWMFTYEDIYDNLSGTSTNYMPDGKVVMFSTQARCDRYFGPPELLPIISQRRQFYQEMFGFSLDSPPMPARVKNDGAVIRPEMFYFDAYPSADWKRVTLRMQAAPIYATTMTDAFCVITT